MDRTLQKCTIYTLSYTVCIDQSVSVWYAVEQYGKKIDQNVGNALAMASSSDALISNKHSSSVTNQYIAKSVIERDFIYFCSLLYII